MRRMPPKILGVTAVAMIAMLGGGAVAQSSAPVPAAVAASPLPATQALYAGYIADNKMPGIVGAFGMGDQATIFVSAGKVGDGPTDQAAGPDSLWRVYSMTKPVTAMAAMILIEDGKLQLDQPISDFIPEFKTMRVQNNADTIESHPATRPITVRNLMTHTAGLGYNIITKGPLLKLYEEKGILPAAVNADFEKQSRLTRPNNVQEFARRVASVPLIADPGTTWSYSIGLDVLVAVIEKAAKMPFDKFVQKRLFGPLKMNSSYWTVPQRELGRFATNYTFVADRRIPIDPAATSVYASPPSFPYGGAGLVMSASDYDRFLHMLQNYGTLDGVRVMKESTAKLAMSNLLPAGVVYGGVAASTGGLSAPKAGFGAGGSVVLDDPANPLASGTYGWGGAAGSKAWVNPIKKFRGTIMVNYFPGEKYPVREDTLKSLATDLSIYRR